MKKQRGFTLVEIAIVLVIIGLLLGGVLKGGEIIESTKVKSVYNQYRELTAAVISYQDRYSALPGDDAQVATRGLVAGASPFSAGNGNGYLDGEGINNCNATGSVVEACQALYQMRQAGFINGNDTLSPNHAYGGRVGVNRSSNSIGGTNLPMVICFENLFNKASRALEVKYDDGVFNTGSIRGNGNYTVGTPDALNAGRTCMFS